MHGGWDELFYQHDSRTRYVKDVQALCHACGLRWVIPACKRIEDISWRHQGEAASEEQSARIRTLEVAHDIDAGLTDTQLISKYQLTPRQLEVLLVQLVERGLLSGKQIEDRLTLADTTVTQAFDSTRKSIQTVECEAGSEPDAYLDSVPSPSPEGPDLNETGVSTVDVTCFINDVKLGLSDSYLMKRYGLLPKQLEFMFQRLLDSGRMTLPEMYERTSVSGSSITRAFMEVYESLRELDE